MSIAYSGMQWNSECGRGLQQTDDYSVHKLSNDWRQRGLMAIENRLERLIQRMKFAVETQSYFQIIHLVRALLSNTYYSVYRVSVYRVCTLHSSSTNQSIHSSKRTANVEISKLECIIVEHRLHLLIKLSNQFNFSKTSL